MSDFNDGGPAFPVAEDHQTASDLPWTGGLSLRDWFAGQALAGLNASDPAMTSDRIAEFAYKDADAMLAERARKEGQS